MNKLIIAICIILSGCAATNKSSLQEIRIDSNIAGAIVELDGVEIGRTPFMGKVKKDGIIKVKTDYAYSDIQIEKKKHGGTIFGTDIWKLTDGSKSGGVGGGATSKGDELLAILSSSMIVVGAVAGGVMTTGALVCVPAYGETICGLATGAGSLLVAYGGMAAMYASNSSNKGKPASAAWEYSPSQYYVEFKPEERPSLDFINDVAIRYFTTVNHSQIAIDAEGGEYMNALAELMSAKMDREAAKQNIYEALEESNGDQAAFGDALVERFRK